MCFFVPCRAGAVSPMPPVASLLSLLRDCAGQEEPPAQSPLHPNPLQTLLLPWPPGAVCGMGTTPGLCPTASPRSLLGSLLAWAHSWRCCGNNQRCWLPPPPLHPCPSQRSGHRAGWPQGPAVLPVPGSQVRDKGHPVGQTWCWGDAHPIPLLGCPSPALLDPLVPVLGCPGAVSPPDPARPVAAGATCAVGAVLPAWGAQAPLATAAVRGVAEHRAGLSPRRGVPTSPPSSAPTPACGAPRAARHRQGL